MASIGIPALTFASGVVLPFSDCITALLWSARTSHSSSNTGDPDEPSLGSVAYSMRARSGASRSNAGRSTLEVAIPAKRTTHLCAAGPLCWTPWEVVR